MTQNSYAFTQRVKDQNLDMRELIQDALTASNGNLRLAASDLGITRQGLQYHMEKNGISIQRCVVAKQKSAS